MTMAYHKSYEKTTQIFEEFRCESHKLKRARASFHSLPALSLFSTTRVLTIFKIIRSILQQFSNKNKKQQ